jgi:hypothetical protein
MRHVYLFCLTVLLAGTGCASSKYYRNAKLDTAPKKVTLLMVEGPDKMLKTGKDLPQQQNLDLLKKKLTDGLKEAGFTPVEMGPAAVSMKKFEAAFSKALAAAKPADAATLRKQGEEKFTAEFGMDAQNKLSAATGTARLVDYQTPGLSKDEEAQYSETFRKASGEIASGVKSALYAVARHRVVMVRPAFSMPGTGGEQIQTVVDFALFTTEGNLLFREHVSWMGNQTATVNGMHLALSESKMVEDSQQGIDKAVESIVTHLKGK